MDGLHYEYIGSHIDLIYCKVEAGVTGHAGAQNFKYAN
jgi:hypothetical protein